MSGHKILPNSAISSGRLMPTSIIQNFSSPVAASMDRGRPIWLFRFMGLRATGPSLSSTWASSSFTVVLPAEPVTATTRARLILRQNRARRPKAGTATATGNTGTRVPAGPSSQASASLPFSATTATAPDLAASAAKVWPSKCSPGMQKNKSPAFN